MQDMEQEQKPVGYHLELCFTEKEIEALMRMLKSHPEMQDAPEEVEQWTQHLIQKLQQ